MPSRHERPKLYHPNLHDTVKVINSHRGGGGSPVVEFTAQIAVTTDAASYSFSGVSIGSPSADRYVFVAIASRTTNSGSDPTVTIGGVIATKLIGAYHPTTTTTTTHIYAALVPTGSTATVVVTFGASMLRCSIAAYRVTNWGGSLIGSTADADRSAISGDVDLSIGGTSVISVGAAGHLAAVVGYTGLVEDYNITVEAIKTNGAHGSAGVATWSASLPGDFEWSVCAVSI